MVHVTFHFFGLMKRADLVRLTGYTPRHISRVAASIPGASRTAGGQWIFDETQRGFPRWVKKARSKKNAWKTPRLLYKRRPKKKRWGSVPMSIRPKRRILTMEHYTVLDAGRLDTTGRLMWLKLAKIHKLSPHELQLSIRKTVVTRIKVTRRERKRIGVSSFHGFAFSFELLMRQIYPVLPTWTADIALSAIEKLSEVEEFIDGMRHRFKLRRPPRTRNNRFSQ